MMWVETNDLEHIVFNISDAIEILWVMSGASYEIIAMRADGFEMILGEYDDEAECESAYKALLFAIHEGHNLFKMPECVFSGISFSEE